MEDSYKKSRLDHMEEKRSQVVGYHKFLKKYIRSKENPICFVEGEDEKYYYLRVKLRCENRDPVFITCGNKEGVLNACAQINEKYQFSSLKLLFFVDSDFDPSYNSRLVYETPYHSIENFYTSLEVVERIMKNEFKLDEDGDELAIILSLYLERQVEFHKAIVTLNAWIACQQDLRNQGNKEGKLKLKDKKLTDFVAISLEKVEAKYDSSMLAVHFPEANKIEDSILDEKINQLQTRNMQQVLRGKFEVEFLKKFLELVKEDLGKSTPEYFKKRKNISVPVHDIVSQFSNYAETSNCLYDYINKVWIGSLQPV